MKAIFWLVAIVLVVVFAGDRLRGFFQSDTVTVAAEPATSRGADAREKEEPRSGGDKPSGPEGASPGNAPELYESPTRRFGI